MDRKRIVIDGAVQLIFDYKLARRGVASPERAQSNAQFGGDCIVQLAPGARDIDVLLGPGNTRWVTVQTLLPDQLHCAERSERFRIGREALLSRSGFGEEQIVPQCGVEQYRSLRQIGKAAGVTLAFEWVLDPAVTYLSADWPLPAEDQAY